MATKTVKKPDILHLEKEINNLWGELNTCTISHIQRQELDGQLAGCEEHFKAILMGKGAIEELAEKLKEVDYRLAVAALHQAEMEMPKNEHQSTAYFALQNIRRQLEGREVSCGHIRHEIKQVMRHRN